MLDLRKFIGQEIFNATGDDTDKVISTELKLSLVTLFTNIANGLKGVK